MERTILMETLGRCSELLETRGLGLPPDILFHVLVPKIVQHTDCKDDVG